MTFQNTRCIEVTVNKMSHHHDASQKVELIEVTPDADESQ